MAGGGLVFACLLCDALTLSSGPVGKSLIKEEQTHTEQIALIGWTPPDQNLLIRSGSGCLCAELIFVAGGRGS